jgi:hypothetical protein
VSIFEIDKNGLAKLFKAKDKSFIIRELVQNAWDESGVTRCEIEFIWENRKARLKVSDDAPEGFYDIAHAYTLFASTRKQINPEKRGRYNLGEKLVIAVCQEAKVTTTTGQIVFTKKGKRSRTRIKTDKGSIFEGTLLMKKDEFQAIKKSIEFLLSPEKITTVYNGKVLPFRKPVQTIDCKLQTEYADENGNMKNTVRKTTVEIHEILNGETAMIYEMGLPIVETGDKYHYNVMQRVPLNMDRDNVRPAFLKQLRAHVLNEMAAVIEKKEASDNWVREATRHKDIAPEAIKTVANKRWGDKVVSFDPGDPHSREKAISNNYEVVTGSQLSKDEWRNFKDAGAIVPASKIFPTRLVAAENIHKKDWTSEYFRLEKLTRLIAKKCFEIQVEVRFIKSRQADTVADYGNNRIRYNISRFGKTWLERPLQTDVLGLILHELAHEFGGHLQAKFYDAIANGGAALALLMLKEPELFQEYKTK